MHRQGSKKVLTKVPQRSPPNSEYEANSNKYAKDFEK